eukprot:gene23222-29614_t
MTKPKILITRPWPTGAQAYMQARYDVTVNETGMALTAAELSAAMGQYDALCPAVNDKLTADILSVPNPRVRMIGNFGAGFEHIDLVAAKAAGIV